MRSPRENCSTSTPTRITQAIPMGRTGSGRLETEPDSARTSSSLMLVSATGKEVQRDTGEESKGLSLQVNREVG